jgi:DNA-binding transcriptional regulator YbjK
MASRTATKKRKASEPAKRRTEIADAALAVLAAEGSRGLTHRAVDEAGGLPSGSTSNHFRTRSALLEAAARRHAELDMPPAADLDTIADATAPLTHEQAKALLVAAMDRVLDPAARPLLSARYELTLESTRRPDLRQVMEESRRRFVGLAEMLLRASGCKTPQAHATQLITVLDGIAAGQLQSASPRLDRDAIAELIERQLQSC